jgi:hypothetical protein
MMTMRRLDRISQNGVRAVVVDDGIRRVSPAQRQKIE